jgi:SP family general alpha glucoside:H+ symporter-like MFS transporter
LIGVFVAGPLTSQIGYRYATLTGLMLLNVFIFSFYFANSLPVMFIAQLLEGIPWGIFIANAPAVSYQSILAFFWIFLLTRILVLL